MSTPQKQPILIGGDQVGRYGWYVVTVGVDSNGNPVAMKVNSDGTATDGASPTSNYRLPSSAATTNATSIKASAGSVASITGYNSNAAARRLKLYNKASAPTVGTDTPFYVLYLPAQDTFNASLAGLQFTTGIAMALVQGGADSDATAVGAGDILDLNIAYK